MCNVHQREIARYMARDRSELKRRISTIRADVRFLIRYRVAPEKLISLLSLLLEINLEYILNFILFELIIFVYCCYSLELFSYVRFLIRIYRMGREKLISLLHPFISNILNFILFELIISVYYCCYLLELFSFIRFLIRMYRIAPEKLISLLHAFISNIFSILFYSN